MRRAAILAAVVAIGTAGCGEDGGDPRLTVSAATSLNRALTDYGAGFDRAEVRLSFAGSDQLVAQVRAGARPDVLATASGVLLGRLAEERLVGTAVEFAYNRLVVAAPRDGTVRRFADLARPGVRIAIGRRSVPVGGYARQALDQVPERIRSSIRANIETEEPDAAAVIARVRGGAVDAGFVYRTDVRVVSALREIPVPADLRPAYVAAVVTGSEHAEEAGAFVLGLRSEAAREALRHAGFEVPP